MRRVNAFFCLWMSSRLQFLQAAELVEGDALTLRRIFSPRKRYYETGELGALEAEIETHFGRDNTDSAVFLASNGKFALDPTIWRGANYNKQLLPSQSRLFIFNVMCFARLGGFEICKTLFQQDLKPAAIVPLCRIMVALSNMTEFLVKEQWESALAPIALAAVNSCRSIIDQRDMRPAKQKYVRKLVMCIKKILDSPYDQTRKLASAASALQMDLAARSISATSLELRIAGIREVTSIVGKLRCRWLTGEKPGELTPDEVASKEVAEALRRGKILDCVLAETDHRKEVLAPCYEADLFGFMYAWKALGEEEIMRMCKLASGEDAEGHFIKAFESLAVHFSAADAKRVFDFVQTTPLSSFTERTVRVLISLARNECLRCCKAARPVQSETQQQAGEIAKISQTADDRLRLKGGCPVFPANTQSRAGTAAETKAANTDPFVADPGEAEPSLGILQYVFSLTHSGALERGLPRELQQTIITEFVGLVSTYCPRFKRDKRTEYVVQCEDMLGQDQSPMQIAKIYFMLTEKMVAGEGKLPVTVPELFQKMVMRLLRLKLSAVQQVLDRIPPAERTHPPTKPQSELYEGVVTAGVRYYQELDERLRILGQVMHLGRHVVRPESVRILCEAFVLKNVSEREKEAVFGFMQRAFEDKACEKLVTEKVFDFFVYEILLRLQPKNYPESAFACLRRFFMIMNTQYHQIRYENGALEVLGTRLIAQQALWEVAMMCSIPATQSSAAQLLVDLYKHVGTELLTQHGREIKQSYVAECMRYISEAAKVHAHAQQSMLEGEKAGCASHALDLLLRCIEAFEGGPESAAAAVESDSLIVTVYYLDAGTAYRVEKTLSGRLTVRQFMAQVSPGYIAGGDVSIITKYGALKESDRLLADIGIESYAEVFLSRKQDVSLYMSAPTTGTEAPALQILRSFCPGHPEQVYAIALMKAKGMVEYANTLLNDEKAVLGILAEVKSMEDEKLQRMHVRAGGKISELISQNEGYCATLDASLTIQFAEVSSKAWALINKLPLENKKMREFVSEVVNNRGRVDWPRMLPLDNLNTMAFALKTFANIFATSPFEDTISSSSSKPSVTVAMPGIKSKDWVAGFVESGGFEYLISLLPALSRIEVVDAAPISPQGQNMAVHCLLIVVRMIKTLIINALIKTDAGTVTLYLAPEKGKEEPAGTSITSQKLRVELGDSSVKFIIETLWSKMVLPTLIQLMMCLSVPTRMKNYFLDVIEDAAFLAGAIICSNIMYCKLFYEGDIFAEQVATILKVSDKVEMKKIIVEFILKTLKASGAMPLPPEMQSPESYLFNYLILCVPQPAEDLPNSQHYFVVLTHLLKLYQKPVPDTEQTVSSPIYSAAQLADVLLGYISDRLSVASIPRNDVQLTGYMGMLLALIDMNLGEQMAEFYQKDIRATLSTICDEIFGSGSPYKRGTTVIQVRKCTHKPIMQTALSLVLKLSVHSKLCMTTALNRMAAFHKEQIKSAVQETGYEGGLMEDGSRRYVGLKNFGMTCYANSILQQLFMMPQFRAEILAIPTDKIPETGCDRVILNLHKMFACLMLSDQQYYLPTDFFKDLQWFKEGPINMLVQRDAEEFFNLLTERLEGELNKAGQKQFLGDLMRITLSSQHESLEPDFHYTSKEIEESDFKLHLNVKGKKSIEEALDTFVQGDILEGDNKWSCTVDGVERKIRAHKQQVIKSLSDVLIIHLNRFEYNSTTGERLKLKNRFSFPMVINMLKWTQDNPCEPGQTVPNADSYNYRLVGAVIHCGCTAEGGHYFSLIRERDAASSNAGKWFKFNDDVVTPYNEADIAADCFGKEMGNDGFQYQYGDYAFEDISRSVDPTAYLLIYQRISPKLPARTTAVPEQLKSSIEQDNLSHANVKIYYDIQYSEFVRDFFRLWEVSESPAFVPEDSTSEEDADPTLQVALSPYIGMCKLAFRYALDLAARAKDFKRYKDLTSVLMGHLKVNSGLAVWALKFLASSKQMLFELLIGQQLEESRKESVDLLSGILVSAIKAEEKSVASREIVVAAQPESYRAATLRFIHALAKDGLEFAKKNWRKYGAYFHLLENFAEQSAANAETLISMGLHTALFQLITPAVPVAPVSQFPPLASSSSGDKTKAEELVARSKGPLHLLAVLLSRCATAAMKKAKLGPEGKIEDSAPEVPEKCMLDFMGEHWDFMQLASVAFEKLSHVLSFLCWGDETRSGLIAERVANSVNSGKSSEGYKSGLELLKSLCGMKDGLDTARFERAFFSARLGAFRGLVDAADTWKDESQLFALDVLNVISTLAECSAEIKRHIKEKHARDFDWAAEFVVAIADGIRVRQNQMISFLNNIIGRPTTNLLNDASIKDKRDRVGWVLLNGTLGIVPQRSQTSVPASAGIHARVEEVKEEDKSKEQPKPKAEELKTVNLTEIEADMLAKMDKIIDKLDAEEAKKRPQEEKMTDVVAPPTGPGKVVDSGTPNTSPATVVVAESKSKDEPKQSQP